MKTSSQIKLLFCSILLLSISCSKDKTMERHLEKKDGDWNIDLVTWTIVEQSSTAPYQRVLNGSTVNAGTFTFDNGGTGKYSYKVNDTISRSGTFSWSVSSQKASLTSATESINYSTFAVTQKAVAYTGTQPSKTKLILDGSETDQNASASISQFVITANFTLTKR
jgi:hypothetical protein